MYLDTKIRENRVLFGMFEHPYFLSAEAEEELSFPLDLYSMYALGHLFFFPSLSFCFYYLFTVLTFF